MLIDLYQGADPTSFSSLLNKTVFCLLSCRVRTTAKKSLLIEWMQNYAAPLPQHRSISIKLRDQIQGCMESGQVAGGLVPNLDVTFLMLSISTATGAVAADKATILNLPKNQFWPKDFTFM